MRVLYHLTMPPSPLAACDAVVQEVEALRAHIGGELIYVNPTRQPGSLYPERLYGLHRLPDLRRREATADLHHLYHSHLYPFPYLRWLRKPVVYTVAGGLGTTAPRGLDRLTMLARIVVNNTRDLETLRGWGLHNAQMIHPGIDIARFTPQPPPATTGLALLAGSAPWTVKQFESKGVNALLAVAQARSDVRLIFLWRGLHFEEMQRRVARHGLGERVTIINQRVNVSEALAQVHAAVVLAQDATLVKAYPHSLLEALMAGRPVLVSRAIPMAEYVEQAGCGVIVENVDAQSILRALDELTAHYPQLREAALHVDRETFSFDRLAYHQLYRDVAHGPR